MMRDPEPFSLEIPMRDQGADLGLTGVLLALGDELGEAQLRCLLYQVPDTLTKPLGQRKITRLQEFQVLVLASNPEIASNLRGKEDRLK